MRQLIKKIFSILFHSLGRIEVLGLENIPIKGGCLLTINHLSILEPPLVFCYLERNDATVLVAKKYFRIPPIRWLVKQVNGIWIDRQRADFGALKKARDFLRNDGLLGLAPEGTRSKTKQLIAPKSGVAFLAAKADVPILPVAISGTENAFSKLLRLQRPEILMHVGKQYRLPPLERNNRAAALKRNTDEIMCRIAALLPPSYRGVYADHPRLKELLNSRER